MDTSRRPITSTTALARHLGLSRWTVSRVLNGHPEVKAETSRRVLAAIEELGFTPSPLARALRGARSGIVGVCFQAFGTPVFVKKISALQGRLRDQGFRALIELTEGEPAREREVLRHFMAMKVDGIVLVGGLSPAHAHDPSGLLSEGHPPVVAVDPVAECPLPSVTVDREHGVRILLEHLLELGHRRFGLVGIDRDVLYGRSRWEGLKAAARQHGLVWERDFTILNDPGNREMNFAQGRLLAEHYLRLERPPTALLALNDQVAVGVQSGLLGAGLTIPGDVSVVGFDNLEVTDYINPRLTTIDQRVDHLMEAATGMLHEQLESGPLDGPGRLLKIRPELVVRGSTGPAPAPRNGKTGPTPS
ncbi:MAG: LacI family transcriptional regulator [Puniceicoccaceae bacterium]|nr:MAG: LacI family transcriptional regulator [Puniceicoccaceae bacterium]